MAKPWITGYVDSLSVRPGETLQFMVSAEGVSAAEVQLVRLIHGDEAPGGPGFIEREVAASMNGKVALTTQFTQAGSFVVVPDAAGALLPKGSFTVHAFVWPTTPGKARQALVAQFDAVTRRGYALGINEAGCLSFWAGDGQEVHEVAGERPLMARMWYFVAASYDAERGTVELYQESVANAYNSHLSPILPLDDGTRVAGPLALAPQASGTDLLLGGFHAEAPGVARCVVGLFNGKLDRPGIQGGALGLAELARLRTGATPNPAGTVAWWDTSAGYTEHGIGDRVVDAGPLGLHGQGYNRPVRAMTGWNWRGKDDCFRLAPEQYGGIYFNEDAIVDCRWQPTFRWTVPQDLKSGVYAARLRGEGVEDHITFFVRPTTATAKVAMLMPTASYLAYANERFVLGDPGVVEAITGHGLILHDDDYFLGKHPEFGSSTYDHHLDGAGVCYTSYRRPIMGLRPRHRMAATGVPWQFAADMSIVWWLEQCGHDFDVITDEDLDREGVALLAPYKVVLNGTHSEYYSERMMDATDQYLARGGRVMYLGANGYYWVVGFRPDEPWCMEVRKLNSGSRAWQAAPGEYYLASTGEKSGIWRDRGRAPQKSMGVGFTSEGMDECMPYRRLPDSRDPRVAWVLEGVGEEFGANGLALGGASGLELDRYDLMWGTPPDTWLLACSSGHSDNYPHVGEEVMFNIPGTGGTQDFQIRGDVTLFKCRAGGAVFATGSIAWGQALPWNNGDNDIARVTRNVLERFVQDGEVA
ncbi:MAG: N,N-dimethylformamidase beta subunit family domain-containing protein [Gammaproteobacteria bacterium]